MVKFTFVAFLRSVQAGLGLMDTFLTDLVREALALGRFDRSLVEALDCDIFMPVSWKCPKAPYQLATV
jgi:hypothetical protein